MSIGNNKAWKRYRNAHGHNAKGVRLEAELKERFSHRSTLKKSDMARAQNAPSQSPLHAGGSLNSAPLALGSPNNAESWLPATMPRVGAETCAFSTAECPQGE